MNYITSYPESTLIYILVLLITTSQAFFMRILSPNLKKVNLIIITLILTLFAGFRGYTVGTDTLGYLLTFETYSPNYIGRPIGGFEIGFYLLSKILLFVVDSPQFLLIFIALIINSLILSTFWYFRDSISFEFSIFTYVSLYYFYTFSGIRQWIAVAIVFYASRFIFEKRYNKFIIYTLIASAIHNTALISLLYLPLDFINWKDVPRKYKKAFYFILLLSPAIIYIGFKIISNSGRLEYYGRLLAEDYLNIDIGYVLFIKLTILFFVFITFKQKEHQPTTINFYKKVRLIYFVGIILSFSGYFYENVSRIGWYFMIYEVIFFSMIAKFRKYWGVKLVVTLLIILLFIISLLESAENQMPYIPFWKYN